MAQTSGKWRNVGWLSLLSVIISILSLCVAIYRTESGWAAYRYEKSLSQPLITGKIIQVMHGKLPEMNIETVFLVYAYLVNENPSTVHILQYELEVKIFGKDYEPISPAYRGYIVQNINFTKSPHAPDFTIEDFPSRLITSRSEPLEQGKPIHGFICFASDKPQEYFIDNVESYRLTCIDAYDNEHIIEVNTDEFLGLYLWLELANITLPYVG